MPNPRSPGASARSSSATTRSPGRCIDDDNDLDQLEIEIDDTAIHLLAKAPLATDLRLTTVAMKISQNLERVGDAAVTIARRAIELGTEPQLKPYVDIPRMATMSLEMLRDAITAFINREPDKARAVVPRDLRRGQPQPPAPPRALQLHGRAARDHLPLPQPDDHLEEPRAHRRPRDEHRRGGRLPLRGDRHPALRAKKPNEGENPGR